MEAAKRALAQGLEMYILDQAYTLSLIEKDKVDRAREAGTSEADYVSEFEDRFLILAAALFSDDQTRRVLPYAKGLADDIIDMAVVNRDTNLERAIAKEIATTMLYLIGLVNAKNKMALPLNVEIDPNSQQIATMANTVFAVLRQFLESDGSASDDQSKTGEQKKKTT